MKTTLISFLLISFFATGLMENFAYAGTVLKFDKRIVNIEMESMHKTFAALAEGVLTNVEGDFVVQFKSIISEKDKALLLKEGVKIFRYVPDDAFIVRTTSNTLNRILKQSSRINGFIPFKGDLKLSENLFRFSIFSPKFSSGQRENILISTFVPEDTNVILQKLLKLDPKLKVLDQSGRYLIVRMEINLVPKALDFTGVEYIEKVRPMEYFYMNLLDGG